MLRRKPYDGYLQLARLGPEVLSERKSPETKPLTLKGLGFRVWGLGFGGLGFRV